MKKLLFTIFVCSTLSAGMLNNFSKNLLDTGLNPGLVTIGINPGFGTPVSYSRVGFSYEFKWQITKNLSIVYFETPHKRINVDMFNSSNSPYRVAVFPEDLITEESEEATTLLSSDLQSYSVANKYLKYSPMYHTINDLKIRFHFNLY